MKKINAVLSHTKANQEITSAGKHPLLMLANSLEQIVTSSEDDFLSLGLNLQKVQLISSSQQQKISATMGLFKTKENSGILQQISAHVQRSQKQTQSARQTASRLCGDLALMLKLLSEIDKKGHILERAGLLLHVIGVNTGIECARYPEVEAAFRVVSRATISLAEKIRNATDTMFNKTIHAKDEQSKTLLEAQKNIELLNNLARGSEEETEVALSKVAELIDYTISMVNEAERMSVNITSEINRIVMGIQFHDNLRQRIEHVHEALLETPVLHDDSAAEEICKAYLLVELQKAQLDNLVQELTTLYTTQLQAFKNILQEVSGLEARLKGMSSEPSTKTSRENSVAVLLAGISSLESLNNESQDLGITIRASAERSGQIVEDMSNAVKSTFVIANDLRINALNAIIKAAKFGREGESLQVLAQGMVTVSKDTRQLIDIFNELLEQLRKLTQHETTQGVEPENLSAENDFDSAQVQQVFHDFREELRLSHDACHSLTQSLAAEQRNLMFISDLRDSIQSHIDQLSNYTESIQPQQELLTTMRKNFGQKHEERYTMNEEREIHRQIQQQESSAVIVSGDSPSAIDDCLFFDEPAPSSSEPAIATQSETQSNSIELFASTPVESLDTAADEIELWDDAPVSDGLERQNGSDIELFGDFPASDEQGDPKRQSDSLNKGETDDKEEYFGDNVDLF